MNKATPAARPDLAARRDQLSAEFYRAGMKYLIALDEWVGAPVATTDKDLAAARERIATLEIFLHRLYPDEFADTNSGAE